MTTRLVSSAVLAVLLGAAALQSGCDRRKAKGEDDDEAPRPTATEATSERPGVSAVEPAGLDGGGALTNLDAIVRMLGLAQFHQRGHHGQALTIAVLDNGFAGLSGSLGRRLPPDVTVEKAPRSEMADTSHGTKMAEIAYAVATGRARYDASVPGPRILLLNTNGFTNFRAAVDRVVEERPDVVLYAQVWEYGGNGDGGGFINSEVDRAIEAGVLWLNAAGNLGQATWSGPVVTSASKGDVTLPYQGRYVRFTVPQDGTPVKIVLAWNDFDASKDYHTPQDLDLVLEDAAGEELGAGRLVQDGEAAEGTQGRSAHAREIVNARLPAGVYRLRVEARSRNFDAQSRLRLTVDGPNVRLLDRSEGDSLLIPADNPQVVAVGASDTDVSGRKQGAGKPELSVPSKVEFEGGVSHTGTSAAVAIAAGALSVFREAHGRIDHDDVVDLLASGVIGAQGACASGTSAEACPPLLRLKAPGTH